MYIIDGIAYAGEPQPAVKIVGVRGLDNYLLWVRFSTGEAKIFDAKPLLHYDAYKSLREQKLFKDVYIDYGMLTWDNGNIDISTDIVYRDSVAQHKTA